MISIDSFPDSLKWNTETGSGRSIVSLFAFEISSNYLVMLIGFDMLIALLTNVVRELNSYLSLKSNAK